ncbi:pectinesterase [Xylariales sp. PMI_506]|nr:pectinesterase [Xylariales sp. PMI_506]
MAFKLALLSGFIAGALATARTTPPSGSITVCSSGCDYTTVQSAVSSISTSSTSSHSIFIYSGTYTEQVTIPALSGKLYIYGYTEDTSSYADNVVNLQHSSSLLSGAADDEHTGTLINLSENTAIYNINIKNTYGEGSQAIALSAYNTEQGYYGVGLYGYQDTLLAETGNQIYANSFIEGAVDFIFGQHARVWITGSDIYSIGSGAITANGRASSTDVSYYVINECTIKGSTGSGTVYFGRPWSEYARVAFQLNTVSSEVATALWEEWSSSEPNTEDVTFEQYENSYNFTPEPASFSTTLSAAITIDTILGSDYADWVDTTYL